MLTLSVVIPAHNEAKTIDRCLAALLRDAEPGELEVVVVCNGCTDDTARRARRHGPPVSVVEIPEASKVAALNTGDAVVDAFPRLYLDADVELDTAAARRLAATLDGPIVAVSPGMRLDTSSSTWPVRSYLRLWSALPSVRQSLAGRGAFAVSQEGRARFGAFPAVVADDAFVDRSYAPSERATVDDVVTRVSAPRTTADLVRRKTRVFVGNQQVASDQQLRAARSAPASDPTGWLRAVARRPALLVDVPAYIVVTLAAKWQARRRLAARDYSWDRDESSRAGGHTDG